MPHAASGQLQQQHHVGSPMILALTGTIWREMQNYSIFSILEHAHKSEIQQKIPSKSIKNNASQCPRLSWIEIPKNAYKTLLQFQSSYMNYTTKTVFTQLKSRLSPGGFRRLTAIYIHYLSPAFQKNTMGPTGKGTSIGIKSNITITSLPKQLAYYFLRIPPKIPTRI